MTRKSDLERAMAYGNDAYYQAIKQDPAYANTLQKLIDTRPQRNWIQSPFKLPTFTTEQFEASRAKYQAKYGSTINIPGFEDIIHWKPRAKISNEEMAAHVLAQRRGLPSPLTNDQLQELAAKKMRFLRMLQAPEPEVSRNVTSILTAMDNANDALFTLALLGQIATYVAPKALGRLTPIFGWAQGAADVLNLFNVAANLSRSSKAHKRLLEKDLDKNPFHKKFWTERNAKFGKRWPGLGELLQVPQVTDSMFGVGVCLGGIMGTMNDVLEKAAEGQIEKLVSTAVAIQYPRAYRSVITEQMITGPLVFNFAEWAGVESVEQAALATYGSLQALIPALNFFDKDTFFNTVKREGVTLSKATDATIRQLMRDYGQDPDAQPKWPTIDLEVAQLDDLPAAYAQQIRDNLKAYLLKNEGTPTAALIGEAAVGYHGAILRAISDDGVAQVANTAIAGAAKDMAYSSLLFPAATTQETIASLADWIQSYERDHRQQPTTNEIRVKGIELGIKWTSQYPKQTPINVQEVFPGWQAAQDQLGKIFTPGNE